LLIRLDISPYKPLLLVIENKLLTLDRQVLASFKILLLIAGAHVLWIFEGDKVITNFGRAAYAYHLWTLSQVLNMICKILVLSWKD
jgi:hypothetical protein